MPSQLTFTCLKSTIKTLEKSAKYVYIDNFEHISHLFLMFLLLTLDKKMLAWFIFHFEQVSTKKEGLQFLDFFFLRRGDYIPQILLMCQHEKSL